MARALISPAFLFRIEKPPPGTEPGPIDDWELATRLGYFLWSSLPDDELRRLAAAGKLRDPEILAAQSATGLTESYRKFAEQCLAEYDLDGWTVPDLVNPDDVNMIGRFGL